MHLSSQYLLPSSQSEIWNHLFTTFIIFLLVLLIVMLMRAYIVWDQGDQSIQPNDPWREALEQEYRQVDGIWVKSIFFTRDSFGEKESFLMEDFPGDYPHLAGYHIPGDTQVLWQKPAFEKDEFLRWGALRFPHQPPSYVEETDIIRVFLQRVYPDPEYDLPHIGFLSIDL